MKEKDEYINITDFLKHCARGLAKDDGSIHSKHFSYSQYVCSMELGSELQDFGIYPEKRVCIKECEEKNYIHKNIKLEEYPVLIDILLIQILAVLNGSHCYITLYSSYFLHHSKIICCNDNFYLEKCFWVFLNTILPNDDKHLEKFLKKNSGFVQFSSENGIDLRQPKEIKKKDDYWQDNLFIFFEIVLIYLSSSFVIIDSIISRNYLIHRDEYKETGTCLEGTLVFTCRNKFISILKNIKLVKKCILKFVEHIEKKETDKKFIAFLKRLKFITYFVSILININYLWDKKDKYNKKDESTCKQTYIQKECKEAIKCIKYIKRKLCIRNDIQEVFQKYFNIYLLMHKVEYAPKYIPNISVEESYTHYKNVLKDIYFIDTYFRVMHFYSSYFEIKSIIFYQTYHSYSSNLLAQCIAQTYLQKISKKWTHLFQEKEKALIEECIVFEKNLKYSLGDVNVSDNEQEKYLKKDVNTEKKNWNKAEEKKYDIDEALSKNSNSSDSECDPMQYNSKSSEGLNEEIDYYYNIFSTIFNKSYIYNDEGKTNEKHIEKQKLHQNIKNNIYVNYFLFLFYTEFFNFIDLIKRDRTQIYVKNIIFNDLTSFGFSADLFILFTNFVYIPETFFFNIEHKLKIKLNIEEYHFNQNDINSCWQFERKDFLLNDTETEKVKHEENQCHDSKKTLEDLLKKDLDINDNINVSATNEVTSKKKKEITMKQFRQKISTQFEEIISNIQQENTGESFMKLYKFIEEYNFINIKTDEEIKNRDTKETLKEKNEEVDERQEIVTKEKERTIRNRIKFLLLCKMFDMFYQYLHFIISRALYTSFLLPARQHSTLIKGEKEFKTLYKIVNGLVFLLRLYNLTKETESILNYFNCILHTFQMDIICLSLCIELPSTQEFAQTYYVLSICFKELAGIVLKRSETPKIYEDDKNWEFQKAHKTNDKLYITFYKILSQCCDFLLIYFMYTTYTNAEVDTFESDSFGLKYGKWKNTYVNFCNLDFCIYHMNKSLFRHALICKTLQIDSSNEKFFFANPTNKKKYPNLKNIEQTYMITKEMWENFVNYSTFSDIKIDVFPIFKDSYLDIDVPKYLKKSISEIRKNMKLFIEETKNSDNNVFSTILNLFIKKCYKVFSDDSYLDLPKLCLESTSLCLNPNYEMIKQHPLFWKLRLQNATEKREENIIL